MRNSPVNWYQGLFILPHHLQAADAYSDESHLTSQRWDHPYGYGLHRFAYSKDGLEGGVFRVTELEGRTQDGTMLCLDPREHLELDLSAVLGESPAVDVHLAVPHLKPGGENVARDGENAAARYRLYQTTWKDETGWSSDQDIECRKLGVELLATPAGESKPSGYETLKIARIMRVGERAIKPTLDKDYIPPVLNTTAWPQLREEFIRGIRDVVNHHVEELSEALSGVTIGGDRLRPAESFRILMLDRLNEAYTVLDLLGAASGVHPFMAYTELARILSRLAVFSSARKWVAVKPYDHDDLGTIFRDIREKILRHLRPITDPYLEKPFLGTGLGMSVTLEPKWFEPDWEWYIGVERSELRESALDNWLTSENRWIVASERELKHCVEARSSGLKRRLWNTEIPDLYDRSAWTYYAVVQNEDESPEWRGVRDHMTLAMQIRSVSAREDARYVDVEIEGTRARLRFVLFAVRR